LGDITLPSFGDLANQLEKETGISHQDEIDKLTEEYESLISFRLTLSLVDHLEQAFNLLNDSKGLLS